MPVTTDSLGMQVRQTIADLAAAGEAYRAASDALARAVATETTRRNVFDYAETALRAKLHRQGVEGRNEAERKAYLDNALDDDEDLDELRTLLDQAVEERQRAEGAFRAADQAQKSLRAILAALTALCGRE